MLAARAVPRSSSRPVPAGTARRRNYRLASRAKAREATRRRILDAAYEAFGARRYEDVTIGELAMRAGTSVRTVYRLVGTKERLHSSWLREGAPGMESRPDPSVLKDVHAFVHALVDFYEQRGAAILAMLSQEDSVPALRPLLDGGRERYDKGIERAFDHLLRGLRGATRKRRHLQLMVVCDVYMWSLLRQGRKLPRSEVERVLVEMLSVFGTAPRPGQEL